MAAHTSLEKAITMLHTMVSDRDVIISYKPKNLIIPEGVSLEEVMTLAKHQHDSSAQGSRQ